MKYKTPVGWQHESHRHYLAAKGIKTRHEWRYFDAKTQKKAEELHQRQEVVRRAKKEFEEAVEQEMSEVKAMNELRDSLNKKDPEDLSSAEKDTRDFLNLSEEEARAVTDKDFMDGTFRRRRSFAKKQSFEEFAKKEKSFRVATDWSNALPSIEEVHKKRVEQVDAVLETMSPEEKKEMPEDLRELYEDSKEKSVRFKKAGELFKEGKMKIEKDTGDLVSEDGTTKVTQYDVLGTDLLRG